MAVARPTEEEDHIQRAKILLNRLTLHRCWQHRGQQKWLRKLIEHPGPRLCRRAPGGGGEGGGGGWDGKSRKQTSHVKWITCAHAVAAARPIDRLREQITDVCLHLSRGGGGGGGGVKDRERPHSRKQGTSDQGDHLCAGGGSSQADRAAEGADDRRVPASVQPLSLNAGQGGECQAKRHLFPQGLQHTHRIQVCT